MSGNGKVVIVGLDGATFRVLRPLVEAGVMPTLAHFLQIGASGTLLSTRPPVTCPAWPTIFTGVNPGKHGVFSFSYRDPHDDHMRSASSADVAAPTLWDVIGEADRRVAVLNVPITFPAGSVNGVMMTGFVSPEDSPRITWPESLGRDLRRQFGDLSLNWGVLSYRPRSPARREAHVRRINELLSLRSAEFEYILSRCDPEFCFLVHEYPDRVQHLFYHLLDPLCEAYHSVENQATVALLQQGFAELDAALARLVQHFGTEANYIVISDHGFDAVSRWVYVNNLLEQRGLLATDGLKAWTDVIVRKARVPAVVRSRLGLEQSGPWHRHDPFRTPLVDYARTRAFAGPQLEHAVYVNVKGRCPRGSVGPGKEYERVRQEIIEVLSSATDPCTGGRVFEGVWPREAVYEGQQTQRAPDVIYEVAPGYMVSNATLPPRLLRGGFLRDIRPGWDLSGYHCRSGIFIAAGPAFRCTQNVQARVVDVAPTVLYLMDLPIRDHMDGRIIEEALRPELLERRSRRECAAGLPMATKTGSAYTPQEQLEVTRRLEELGYL